MIDRFDSGRPTTRMGSASKLSREQVSVRNARTTHSWSAIVSGAVKSVVGENGLEKLPPQVLFHS